MPPNKQNERNNQLTNISDCKLERIIFSEPVVSSIPNSPVQNKRISISIMNNDRTIGDLIFPTERLFSFGVQESKDPTTQQPNGYTLPLCMWNKNGATPAEKEWTTMFNKVSDYCKEYVLKNKAEIGKYDLEPADLKKFNPMYIKKDKGVVVEGAGPVLYTKLISSKKNNKIISMFFNPDGDVLDPISLLGKYSYVTAAVKIESIFIATKISLQVKLYEATIEPMEMRMSSLLPRKKTEPRLIEGDASNLNQMPDAGGDDGSVHGSDDEREEKKVMKKEEQKPVRKIFRPKKAV